MDAATADASPVLQELKRLRPSRVKAFPSDGSEARDIAVPPHRKRYLAVAEVLSTFAWARIECMNEKGQLLGVVAADGEVQPEQRAGAPKEYAFLEILIHGQKMALSENRATIETLMSQFAALAGALTDRVAALEKNYSNMLNLATRAQLALATSQQEEGGEDAVMMQILQLLAGGGPKKKVAPPANGTTPPTR